MKAILVAVLCGVVIGGAACGHVDAIEPGAAWTEPQQLTESVIAGGELAATGSTVVAFWLQAEGGRTTIYARRHTDLGGWSSPLTLSGLPSIFDIRNHRFGLDRAGNAVAAWLEYDDTESRLLVSRLPAGAGWDAPRVVDREPFATGGAADGLDLEVEPGGDALVAWASRAHVRAFHWSGGRWSPPVVSAGGALSFAVTVGLHGRSGLVCWGERAGPQKRAVARSLDFARSESEEATLFFGREGGGLSAVVAPDGGAAMILNGPTGARVVRYEPGRGWQPTVALGAQDVRDLQADARGGLVALASEPDAGGLESLSLSYWTHDIGWLPPEAVLTGATPDPRLSGAPGWTNAALQIDPVTRTPYVMGRKEPNEIWLARSSGRGWLAERMPGHAPGSESSRCIGRSCYLLPRLAADSRSAWILWWEPSDLGWSIWVQRRLDDAR